jgi:hypothetical protein
MAYHRPEVVVECSVFLHEKNDMVDISDIASICDTSSRCRSDDCL